MPVWRLTYFTLDDPQDAHFVDYEDVGLLMKHLEDAVEESHIIIVTQIDPSISPQKGKPEHR